MRENWDMVKVYWDRYWGESIFFVLFAICLVYIFICRREKRKIFVYPSVLLLILVMNPWLYQHIWSKVFTITYWRVFWMLPMLPVIAYCVMDVLKRLKRPVWKLMILAVALLVIVKRGQYMYTDGVFSEASNPYKLPKETVDVANALLELEEQPWAVVPAEMYSYIRQYSTDIKLMYGRNVEGFLEWAGTSSDTGQVNYQMTQEDPKESEIARRVRENGYTYIVASSGHLEERAMEKYGYAKVKEVSNYSIYQEQWFGDEAKVWKLEKHVNQQTGEAFVTIMDIYDRLLVIDGGSKNNTDFVRQVMQEKGNMADEWIVTNTSQEISGAYFMISNQLQEIRYREALWPDLLEQDYLQIFEDDEQDIRSWDECVYDCYQWYKEDLHFNIGTVEKGEEQEAVGLQMRVLNAYDETKTSPGQTLRDNSLVLQLKGEESKILYVSDLTAEGLTELVSEYGDELESDYLIWNCRESELLSVLQETVKADDIISLKDSSKYEKEIH